MSINIFNDLIKKTSDYDKDQRFMATADIINNLSKVVAIDEILEKKICSAVLKQLDDKSNDVQSVAVKCLGILVKKVHATQITDICDKLCSLILEGQDALRDIYSIGLKTLIADIPDETGAIVATRLVNRLIYGISRLEKDDITKECLDNMNDLLRRFGSLISNEHEDVMNAIIAQLVHDKPVIKKRAAVCLGSLAVVLSESLLNKLIEVLLVPPKKEGKEKKVDIRTLIQTFGAISRTVGHRLGRHLDRLIPLFLECCGDPNDESQQTEEANELREYCFPGLESFVLRCRKEVTPYLNKVLDVSLSFIRYDPNYTYDEDNQDGETMGDDDYYEQEVEEEYGGGSDDDDDGSWKVRKSAVKVVLAVIISRPDMIGYLYAHCADLLISRIKDREETVRLDIILSINSLLQISHTITATTIRVPARDIITMSPRTPKTMSRKTLSSGTLSSSKTDMESILLNIKSRLPSIVLASRSHFDGTSVKTKSYLFTLFRSLALVLQGNMDIHLDLFIHWVENSLKDKIQNLKIDALVFLRTLIDSYDHISLIPYFPRLLNVALSACKDDWYKIIAEGLRLLSSVIIAMRPFTISDENDMDMMENSIPITSYLDESTIYTIYHTVLQRLEALDIDQEIKECSIIAIGKLFSHLGDMLSNQLPDVLTVLRKRLDNEVTRLVTLRAILEIAKSPLQLNVSIFTTESMKDLSIFLRQQSRSLKLTTLQTIDALLLSPSANTIPELNNLLIVILHELSPLINDSDLSLTYGALKLTLTIVDRFPTSIHSIKLELYPRLIAIATSSMIQGLALQSLVDVYKSLVLSNVMGLTYDILFQDLYLNSNLSIGNNNKQAALNIAKCIAGIASNIDLVAQTTTIDRFITDLRSNSTSNIQKQLTLLCLGELGYHVKIEKNIYVKDMIIACFESDIEEVRSAAAYALGHLAMGAMDIFLPIVLQAIDTTNSRYQYLLLSSLREIIYLHVNENKSFDIYLNSVLPGLQRLSRANDDSLRNMVAECIGSLTILHSESLLPWLQSILSSSSLSQDPNEKLAKWTVATALRHTLSRQLIIGSKICEEISTSMRTFLELLKDEDLEVRKASLLLVNSAIHHNPLIIIDYIVDPIQPKLFETLGFKQEKTVDLGPFKHKVDEGLPLRKAALTSIETILDTAPDKLDIAAFLLLIIPLLNDKDEVKLQTHQILIKVSKISPIVLSNTAELFIDPLEKTATKKTTKEGITQPEAERALELIRSAMRVVSVMSKLPDMESNRTWLDFMERLNKAGLSLIDSTL